MSKLEQISLTFLILCNSVFAGKPTKTVLVPVRYRPADDEKIFNVEASSAAHCRYICVQNKYCSTILDRDSGAICTGFNTQDGLVSVSEEEKAWRVFRYEKVNLAMDPGTTCTASSEHINDFNCNNVFDGFDLPEPGHEWATRTRRTQGDWIKITFRAVVLLEQLQLWHRCAINKQGREFEVRFSDNATVLMNGTCDGSNNYKNCTGQARFSQYDFTPAVMTEWVKITFLELCNLAESQFVGFIEVKAIGTFVGC